MMNSDEDMKVVGDGETRTGEGLLKTVRFSVNSRFSAECWISALNFFFFVLQVSVVPPRHQFENFRLHFLRF